MPFAPLTSPLERPPAAGEPLSLCVRMPDGGVLSPKAPAGMRVMDALVAFGLPLRHDCRGRDRCATCRARIATRWAARVQLAGREARGGPTTHGAGDEIRLLCDVVMTADLDGLELELTWDALVPQTNWVAG
jgi:ferredoxin